MKTQIDMTRGPLLGKILLFALPLAASSVLQQLFNSVDVAVVGRFVGDDALAAVGNNGPVINIIVNLFVGLGMGANVVVASLIGQGKTEEIGGAVHTVVAVSLVSGAVLLALGVVLAPAVLAAISTPADVLPLASRYLRIYFCGMPFAMFYNFGSAVLRARGDSLRPLLCLVVSGVANAALNLVLVIAFGMGVEGVAVATVASNAVSAAMVLRFLRTEPLPFRLDFRRLAVRRRHLVWMARVGIPAGLQGMVFSFSNLSIQSAINSFGREAMAGSAAALNYEYFTYFVVAAFSQTAVTFTSQNYGAGELSRCRRVFWLCLSCSLAATAAECAVFTVFRGFFMSVFTESPAALDYAVRRTLRVEAFESMPALYEVPAGCLRALGRSMLPSVLVLLGSCALRLGWLAAVFPLSRSWETLMSVYPVSWLVTGTAVLAAYALVSRKVLGERGKAAPISRANAS